MATVIDMHWTTERAAAVAGLTPAAFLHAMLRKQCIDEDYRVDSMYWQRAGEPLWDAELVTRWAERRAQRAQKAWRRESHSRKARS